MNNHCENCGEKHKDEFFPKNCPKCKNISYANPKPVAVAIVPILQGGILMVRRNIEPQKGKVGFPAGFIEEGESWQEGLVREVREETGVVISEQDVHIFSVESTPNTKNILLFAITAPVDKNQVNLNFKNEETQEVIIDEVNDDDIAFPLHLKVYKQVKKQIKGE